MKTIENLEKTRVFQKLTDKKLHSILGGETTETETPETTDTRVIEVTISNIDSVLGLIR